ncbi:MAG: phosphoribosylglycinamide formyltransferase, partial [Puniceicoccaceae bacterium]|nr:phosphoribosylglycinamide formyltransferase [Puniceicoccaceae bacterium]
MSFKVIVIGSGKGSNAQALLRAEQSGKLGVAEIAAVF